MLADELDLAISYTETAAADAARVTELLHRHLAVYNYKAWLDRQEGSRISLLASHIYEDIPCIILVTRDWFVRPATILECKHLKSNIKPKLVFDYAGEFQTRGLEASITSCEFGAFDAEGRIEAATVTAFAHRIYPSLSL
jgi:hypothetical protein